MEQFLGQVLALITFFLFPVIQFLLLKFYTRKEGLPELWFLPKYGFRLVVRNIPSSKNLYDLKYRVFIQKVFPADSGSSVGARQFIDIDDKEIPLLLSRSDQVMLCFNFSGNIDGDLKVASTDYLGNVIEEYDLEKDMSIVAEYSAVIDNRFNFDVKVMQRVEICFEDLVYYYNQVNEGLSSELKLPLNNVKGAGR